MTSLDLAQVDDPALGTHEQTKSAINHIERIIRVKSDLFQKVRFMPYDVFDSISTLLASCFFLSYHFRCLPYLFVVLLVITYIIIVIDDSLVVSTFIFLSPFSITLSIITLLCPSSSKDCYQLSQN